MFLKLVNTKKHIWSILFLKCNKNWKWNYNPNRNELLKHYSAICCQKKIFSFFVAFTLYFFVFLYWYSPFLILLYPSPSWTLNFSLVPCPGFEPATFCMWSHDVTSEPLRSKLIWCWIFEYILAVHLKLIFLSFVEMVY